MSRKKSKRVVKKPTREKQEKKFSCLDCNRENVVVCSINSTKNQGKAKCTYCGASFYCATNRLSHAIDVYSEWIDSREEKKEKKKPEEDANSE